MKGVFTLLVLTFLVHSHVRALIANPNRREQAPEYCRLTSCCGMTEYALRNCKSYHPLCVKGNTKPFVLKHTCRFCRPGRCRIGNKCVCPKTFLKSASMRWSCRASHGSVYPSSIGAFDNTRRKCKQEKGKRVTPVSCQKRACCEMAVDELIACNALSDRCLLPNPVSVLKKDYCAECPPGECRLGRTCQCTRKFFNRAPLKEKCIESHGRPWPTKPGDKDKHILSCPIGLAFPAPVVNATPPPSPVLTSPSPGVKSSPSPSPILQKPHEEDENNPVEKRSHYTWEIIGIVFGVLGSVAGVVGVFVTAFKRYEVVTQHQEKKFSWHAVDA